MLPSHAYITHVTENCFDAMKGLINSIIEFSEYPLIIYTINFKCDRYNNVHNIITIPLEYNDIYKFPNRVLENYKEYVDRSDINTYKVLRIKPKVMLHAIQNGVTNGVYLDADTIILPSGDDLFSYHDKISTYPLISKGVFELMSINGKYDIENPLMSYLNVPIDNRSFYLQSNTIVFNDNCKNFIQEWIDVSYDDVVTENCVEFCPFSDETVVNVLLWKHKLYDHLPLSFYNVGSFESFVDFWNFDDSDKTDFNYKMGCFRITTDSNDAGWQCIPWNKENIKILHNIKNVDEGNRIIEHIKHNSNAANKKTILYITEHLSTGGLPQVLLKRIENLNDSFNIYVVEISNYGIYDIQRKKIQNIIGNDNFFELSKYDNKDKLLSIIDVIKPDIIHFEEIPELTTLPINIIKNIYSVNRYYNIIESSHTSTFDINKKIFLPDKFLFVSKLHLKQYSHLNIPMSVVEYPIEHKVKINDNILNFDKKFKHVLNVGLFTPGKNQSYIFDVARKLEKYNIKFHFVGNQAENFKQYWEPIMNNKPDNCIIWGERSDLENFYSHADMFLFSSTYELNPLVVKEALGYDMPIIMKNLETYCGMYDNFKRITFDDMSDSLMTSNKVLEILNIPTNNLIVNTKFDFPMLLKSKNLINNGIEIGVLNGEFSKYILDNWPGNLYLVDSWRKLDDYVDYNSRDSKYHITCLLNTIKNIQDNDSRAHILRMLSIDASNIFPDEFFDFIYIDANHKYDDVMNDLNAWFPKLKKGGLFSGDDYIPDNNKDVDVYFVTDENKLGEYAGKFGVTPAVNEFAKTHGYIVNHTTQQYFRQWYFIK